MCLERAFICQNKAHFLLFEFSIAKGVNTLPIMSDYGKILGEIKSEKYRNKRR